MIEVREAMPEDLKQLRPLMEEWIGESNPDGLQFDPDPDILVATFTQMRNHPQGTTLVMLKDGAVIGCIGLVRHNWGACRTANFVSENLWYVAKAHAGHAKTLIEHAKKWAGAGNYFILSINRLSTARAAKGDEFIAALGFKPLYGLHISEVQHV